MNGTQVMPESPAPRFSILMAAFQAEETIARAVRSVLAQTRDDWELLVVDDGSTDSTPERARAASDGDERVIVLSQPNAGPGAARNLGAARARGEYLCILDSDDEFAPTYLESMTALADAHPQAALLSCNAICVNPDGSRSKWLGQADLDREQSFSLLRAIRSNEVFVMATIRADAFRAVGGFATTIAACEDYDLWLRLLAAGHEHRYTPESLGVYYRLAGSTSSNRVAEANSLSSLFTALIDTGELTRQQRRAAIGRVREVRARAELERRRIEHDYAISRRDAYKTANAFGAPSRRIAARLMAVLSPRWYLRVFSERRTDQEAALYRGEAGGSSPRKGVTP